MPTPAKQRRTWFALLKERGVADEDRHDVQFAHTGKASLRDWTPDDFDRAIAALQRAGGQHQDARAHVCADRSSAPSDPSNTSDLSDCATEAQATYVEDLCDEVSWRTGRQFGPRRYACATVLRGDHNLPRRAALKAAYDGTACRPYRIAAWSSLTRQEGSDLIKALRKAAQVYAVDAASTIG
jgi:hypothetical protein